MPASITELFMSSCKCLKYQNGYYDWNCVSSKCLKCSSMQPVVLSFQSSKENVSYYQFEITKSLYVKTGKDNNEIIKISEKTEKVLKNSSYEKLYHMLVSLKCTYLKHKYQVYNDKHHWSKILRTTEGFFAICHLDYSEHLTQSYKYEPQSSHFNKAQYPLYCSVKHSSDQTFSYFYHLSDDLKPDFAFTETVVGDLLKKNGSTMGVSYISNLIIALFNTSAKVYFLYGRA